MNLHERSGHRVIPSRAAESFAHKGLERGDWMEQRSEHGGGKHQTTDWLRHAKTVFDHLGGVEGILSHAQKIQHVLHQVREIAPLAQTIFSLMKQGGKDGLLSLFDSGSDDHTEHEQTPDVSSRKRNPSRHRKSKRKKTSRRNHHSASWSAHS